ncbi:MAG: MFS transporter [Solirubrobacterales bacterium]|nr:MFS transporter [Solirubrobacterales bacterium]
MSAFHIPDFRRLWLAGLISTAGDWLLLVSLPIVVYQQTGSTIGTALAFLIELAPPVALAPIAGRIADGSDRRRTLTGVSLVQAAALIPLLLVRGPGGLPIVYSVIAAQAALASIFEPTKNALLPTLVDRNRLLSANSLVGLNENLGRLVGGPVGGLLLALGGLSAIVVADAASFLLAAALIAGLRARLRMPPATVTQADQAPTGAGLPAPPPPHRIRTALKSSGLRRGLLVLFIASVAQGIFVVLFVVFVARALHGGPGEIGLLRGVQALGAIGAGLVLAAAARIAAGRLIAYSAFAFGLISLAIWHGPHLTVAEPVYVALFVAVGAPGVGIATGLTTWLQKAAPDGRRGAAFALAGVAAAAGEATGILIAGTLGDSIGLVSVLTGQAVLYLIAGLFAAGLLTDSIGQPEGAGHHDARRRRLARRSGAPTLGSSG